MSKLEFREKVWAADDEEHALFVERYSEPVDGSQAVIVRLAPANGDNLPGDELVTTDNHKDAIERLTSFRKGIDAALFVLEHNPTLEPLDL